MADNINTKKLSELILFVITAHEEYPKQPDNSFRFWDKRTPYSIHPIWCAMTLLTETTLSEELRWRGAQALLLHDVVEDTTATLPSNISDEVVKLIQELTFETPTEGLEKIFQKSEEAQLLKLYDMVSNLLDWDQKLNMKIELYKGVAKKLAHLVEKQHGNLNIVSMAYALIGW
ncbi:hypothetical protein A3H10_01265 [Candidatus Uhrbacteria bacterium RIFCSPLOWO2_12_FULL_46_10]|uniref:HD domain-containing protein n=1 Tax=Candidatus Uhrbacteria bacterium RIFCSPLOWO2_01_FULL_47_25 TaxID=1802402 RepID=A0A1F7UPH5_9BACT|nr:MAG: hypothetical protein A2752_01935 [Candidatus Uhrbacteria bacterium RIFCSPHIGHO2_01_FULL_46_23]OGL69150.1 MAG: hypothetical protein A3D60_04590 [Candidatus Uhrbacteria bacterium RIFCSPHIGHO2_02_FULL_47_29]OGL75569.1 MAG: hypothetical protein A3E96_03040 [Candidatus Uhrbacteria bacterium RIFCSPHIGHO2_12_FULL_46_13]OGL80213.1 MAG: hypothetical protein A2936_02495 [Candidatus Uhrbacteria bacterium RIFCSPLOWO2_01_FULL_47_25]OGL85288.1 MAG: hypothetical protein A3I37_00400 [Candidatus Uhrbact